MFLPIPVSRCNCLTPACLLSRAARITSRSPYWASEFADRLWCQTRLWGWASRSRQTWNVLFLLHTQCSRHHCQAVHQQVLSVHPYWFCQVRHWRCTRERNLLRQGIHAMRWLQIIDCWLVIIDYGLWMKDERLMILRDSDLSPVLLPVLLA